ncbi:MAG: uridine kinase, partial [Spirochaetota bacterium]|nr:uridine kinase [Spirochaetota bacterium]
MALSFIDSYFQQIPEGKIPVIGISGASGSGKTFLAESIAKAITDVTIVHEDNYYHELAGIKLSDSGNKNYDHPDSFDHTLLYEHIIALSKNESISQPVYNYQTHSRTKDYRVMNPGRLLIVEGILIYCDDKISQAIDIKIYMDTAPDICLLRRIQRDSKVRGRSMNQV